MMETRKTFKTVSLKQIKFRKIFAHIIMVFLIAIVFTQTASATIPPGITFVVNFPPDDLTLSIHFADGHIAQSEGNQTAWERQYRFGLHTGHSFTGAKLLVQSTGKSFERELPASLHEFYTLDLASETLTPGLSTVRLVVIVLVNVLLVLFLKGLILFAFRYREKASWLVFLITSLITQGGLYTFLADYFPINPNGCFLGLMILGLIVMFVEMLVFALTLKEHGKVRAMLYAVTANIASLILGVILLFALPI